MEVNDKLVEKVEKLDVEDEDFSDEEETIVDFGKDGAFAQASDFLHYSESLEIPATVEFDRDLANKFQREYTNVINEFADVEIFLISMDSLLCEFTAHLYHNWTLAGQTIVLAHQVRAFFERLNDLNAKYKLVWFLDLEHKYKSDSILNFVYSYLVTFLDNSEWSPFVEKFKTPLDPEWDNFLKRLTPSFLLMSIENPSSKLVRDEVSFVPEFVSILVQLVNIGIPVIHFEAFAINFSTVFAYRIKVIPIQVENMEERISSIWSKSAVDQERSLSAGECKNHVDLLALILKTELKREKSDADFEKFCLSVLLSAFIGLTVGYKRFVPEGELPKVSDILVTNCRRRVISALTNSLKTLDVNTVKFSLDDLWDGRLIYWIFANAIAGRPTLPYRLQEDFAKMHAKVGFKEALVTDENDTLISPSDENNELLVDKCEIFSVSGTFFDEIFKNNSALKSIKHEAEESDSKEAVFRSILKWRFHTVDERLLQVESKVQLTTREQKQLNRQRQKLSQWYQAFSDSLEGRGNDLLVDFSRTPQLPTIQEDETPADENGADKGRGKKAGGGKKEAGGKKGAAKPVKLSKKDQILEANKQVMIKKQVESDRDKILYATKVKINAIQLLKEVRRKLVLDESKAICAFELAQRYADDYYTKAKQCKIIDEKRAAAIELVGQVKECFTKHWQYLDDGQKDKIQSHWIALGFFKDAKRKPIKEYDLDINMVYYQMYYGGRLIDVQSDPRTDDRVTGFKPDAWQRRMLDIVDKDQSALIVAPTSAGKTFVSYYCIEKVLRQSNEQIVVYVCPAKALMNQVCGSIYARFRNKPITGNTVLFGTMTNEFSENALNCQVLVTIPECLEHLLLSPEPRIQEVVSRIRYVILDEVHSINTAKQGHIWEHIFLIIQCPFLALSATIGNIDVMHKWLQDAEEFKKKDRKVELIVYKERWSELELSIQQLKDCPENINFARDNELFLKGIALSDLKSGDSSIAASLVSLNQEENVLHYFTPYSVYKPEKIRMFSIPDDQQLTARQIMDLYSTMSQVDEQTKKEFEPTTFFGLKTGSDEKIWLTRTMLRKLESALKERFLYWLHHDDKKSSLVFEKLEADVKEDFDKRMKPFNMFRTALYNIVPLIDQLKTSEMLPSICFNDNRDFCEQLAIHVFNDFESREHRYMDTADFKKRFNFKEEDRLAKNAKRERDAKEKGKKKRKRDEDGPTQELEEQDDDTGGETFSLLRIKLKKELAQFRLIGRSSDDDLYEKTIDRLKGRSGGKQSTKTLLKLFERGIGFHHDGLSAPERGAVEILFRNGYLGILFSTSTLALGMNMPCKTVVFGIDTPQLTPLMYRQMSGRAGRRGYDPAGNVIFMSLPTSKIRRLLTASLATLRGNVPYTASFLLRLFNYVNGNPEEFQTREEIAEAFSRNIIDKERATLLLEKLADKQASLKKPGKEKNQFLDKNVRASAALTLLKQSFALHTRKENKEGALPAVLQALTFFNIQLLRRLQLIDENGETTGFAKIAVHLGVYEPGNLLFVHLLQIGAFHHLRKQIAAENGDKEFNETFVLILANLFTKRRLPIDESLVENPIALKPLPEEFDEKIKKYNSDIEKLFIASLQLFFPEHQIENEFFRLSGVHDGTNLSMANVISAFDDDICLDPDFIPSYLQDKDHRGRTIYRNSYAYDFFIHGSKDLLISENKIDISEVWYAINDFNKVLQSLNEVLKSSARVGDPISEAIQVISESYDKKFRMAFGMKASW